jgi:phenylalanyl-tRNA synthetase beta chain
MSGIMETFQKNRRKPVPQKIFELGNVLILSSEAETGVKEYRHLAFGMIGPESGYADGRSVLDAVLSELGLKGTYKPASHPSFFEGRCAEVTDEQGCWLARIGELHPEVITNFNLSFPIVLCELRLKKVI